ncbi:MAG TPA: alpha/beta fold hydrolase [Acidobacteriota bacterium]|nr:alpha/beta fold hydrolase [Acidobacteriota bacterium]
MRWWLMLTLALLCCSLHAEEIAGTWIGTFKLAGSDHPLRIQFQKSSDQLKGKSDLILDEIKGAELNSIKLTSNKLEFSIPLGEQHVEFSGKVLPNAIDGTISANSQTGEFHLVKIADIRSEDIANIFGLYLLDNNESVAVRTWDELGDFQPTVFHSDGKICALYPQSSSQYFCGSGLLIPLPQTSTYTFRKTDSGMSLEYREGAKAVSGRKLDSIHEIEVEIKNKDRIIPGSLVLPEGKGPFPGVVLVHGSGAVGRDFLGPIGYLFAQKGIAALTYDKRKDWMDSSFENLAEDAAASLRYLRNRSEIDSQKVGYIGASQGGWIAPLAASLEAGATFLILFSGPAVTPAEHEIMRAREEAKAQGASKEEIDKAVQELQVQLAELRTEETRLHFEKQLKEWNDAGKSDQLETSSIANPRFLLWYRNIMDYDPVPALSRTKIPVLALYGELDLAVPPRENIEPLKRYLSQAGNQNLEVHVFPHSNHVLLECKTGSRAEFPYLNRFVPGLFTLISDWIKNAEIKKAGQ